MPSMTTALEQRAASRVAPIGLLFLVTTSVGWGLHWPVMKFVFSEWPPLSARGWAGVIGAAALALLCCRNRRQPESACGSVAPAHHLGEPQRRAVGRGDELCAALAWERFQELRVPNPPDFLGFIADELAERRTEIAALHTLQKRLATLARCDGQQILPDTF